MKIVNSKKELQKLSFDQLRMKFNNEKKKLLHMRLNARVVHIKDYSEFKKLRKHIARILTYINKKK